MLCAISRSTREQRRRFVDDMSARVSPSPMYIVEHIFQNPIMQRDTYAGNQDGMQSNGPHILNHSHGHLSLTKHSNPFATAGARYNIELEIVLPGDMTVSESHDLAMDLQHKVMSFSTCPPLSCFAGRSYELQSCKWVYISCWCLGHPLP